VDDSSRSVWCVESQARPLLCTGKIRTWNYLSHFRINFRRLSKIFLRPSDTSLMTDTLARFRCHKPVIRRHLDTYVTATWKYQTVYWGISWSRVHLENITSSQLVKKFLAFFGTRRFITTFTTARQLSLSWARSIQSLPPAHLTSWRFILILSFLIRLGLPNYLENIRRPAFVEL
jgi:hypothetical protein